MSSNASTNDTDIPSFTIETIRHKLQRFTGEYQIEVARKGRPWKHSSIDTYRQLNVIVPFLLKEMIEKRVCNSIRDLMYMHQSLFLSEAQLDGLIDNICSKTGLHRRHLNIVSDSFMSGYLVAHRGFSIKFNNGTVKTYEPSVSQNVFGHPLPDALGAYFGTANDYNSNELIEEFADEEGEDYSFEFLYSSGGKSKPDAVLICEKMIWPNAMAREGFFDNRDVIVLCSKGHPRHNLFAMVKLLHEKWTDVPIVVFGDAGPYGISIVQSYYKTISFGHRWSVPVNWGGLFPSEIVQGDNGMENAVSRFTDNDTNKAESLWDHQWYKESRGANSIGNEFAIMNEGGGRKWDMNAFKPSDGRTISQYIWDMLQNKSYLLGPSKAIED